MCHLTGVSKQTVNSALRRLEADGLVKPEAVDGRKKQLSLTAKGTRLAAKSAARVVETEKSGPNKSGVNMNIFLSEHFTYKKLFLFTIPSIAMMIFTSIYGVVDGICGRNINIYKKRGKSKRSCLLKIQPLVIT